MKIFTNQIYTDHNDGDKRRSNSTNVTFSGLLNCLDGFGGRKSGLFFTTTNHIKNIDGALIRPGRVDRIFTTKLASKNQIYDLVLKFFPEEKDLAIDVMNVYVDETLSPAEIQGLIFSNHKTPQSLADIVKQHCSKK